MTFRSILGEENMIIMRQYIFDADKTFVNSIVKECDVKGDVCSTTFYFCNCIQM